MQAPPVIDGPIVGMLRNMLERAEAQNRHLDGLALFHFASLIAGHYDLDADDVLDQIEQTPPHILEHARDPQGLTAVAIYLASVCGVDGPALTPTIH